MRLPLPRVLLPALFACGCDVSAHLEPDPLDVPLGEIIRLDRSPDTDLVADGASTASIIAFIPRDTRERTVKFTTSRGGFLDVGGAKEVSVTARPPSVDEVPTREDLENLLVARATFLADTSPGTAVIRGAVAAFSDTLLVKLLENTP